MYKKQYERMLRKYSLIKDVYEGIYSPEKTADYFEDDMCDFFIHCYHLKDWILNDPAVDNRIKQKVESYINSSKELSICADMCNGVKHLDRKQNKIRSGEARTIKQKAIMLTIGTDSKLQLIFQINAAGRVIEAFDVAKKCKEQWESFLRQNNLL